MSWIWIKDYRLGIDSNINKSLRGLPYSNDDREIEYKVAFDGVVDTPKDIDDFAEMAKGLLTSGVTSVIAIFSPMGYGRRKK